MSPKIEIHRLSDGTIAATLDDIATLEAHVEDTGVLRLDYMQVAEEQRRKGIGTDLVRGIIEHVGADRIRSLSGRLTLTNAQVLAQGVDAGLTQREAAASTPIGRSASRLGFTRIEYDSLTAEFTASR